MNPLIVNEIFYSLQGEGGRAGEASIFIRLSKCNLSCDFCDTDFISGKEMDMDSILKEISQYPCSWIIWTGGEPTLQLKSEHISFFKALGYKQAIETNGTRAVPAGIDYIACSPKNNYSLIKTILPIVDEIRLPVSVGNALPPITELPQASNYFLSPVFDGNNANNLNITYCVDCIKKAPEWKLSLQLHKFISIE